MGNRHEYAGFLSSLLTLFAMICTPLFGLLVDRVGRRATLMCFGSLLLVPVYLIMAYTRIPPLVPMILMGVAFSLIPAVMWPSVTYLVEPARLGTALGLMTMIQNVGLAGYNLLIGWANDSLGSQRDQPGRLPPRDVVVLRDRASGAAFRLVAAAGRDRAQCPRARDDHREVTKTTHFTFGAL